MSLLGAAAADGLGDEQAAGASGRAGWLPGLPSSTEVRPDVDPVSASRDDRQPSDPEAGFFSEDELGVATRSPTAEALNR
jgi:hypothetical protein